MGGLEEEGVPCRLRLRGLSLPWMSRDGRIGSEANVEADWLEEMDCPLSRGQEAEEAVWLGETSGREGSDRIWLGCSRISSYICLLLALRGLEKFDTDLGDVGSVVGYRDSKILAVGLRRGGNSSLASEARELLRCSSECGWS